MRGEWLWTPTPAFLAAWRALPGKEEHQVLEKIKVLEQDPAPDGKVKMKIKHMGEDLYRLRCGNYRVIYTYRDPYVSLLKLERRNEDTYTGEIEAAHLGGYAPTIEILEAPVEMQQPDLLAPQAAEPHALSEPITRELLVNLHIPEQYHQRLLAVQTEEDFTSCIEVPQEYLAQVLDCIYPPTLAQVLQQPVFIVDDLDDLVRYKEGELLSCLLKLSPEQERFVSRAIKATGPTQVKGGPGTGKRMVALYRVRSMIEKRRQLGVAEPHILFTTYT